MPAMSGDPLTFLGIVLVLTVTPGADMALVMRHVLEHGLRAAWPTLLGIETGLLVHITAAVAGLSVLLRDSDVAFTVVKFAGAAWLAWLGASALVALWRSRNDPRDVAPNAEDDGAAPRGAGHAPYSARTLYVRGFVTNLLNVKIALFYIAFLPQFAPQGDQFVPAALVLAAVQTVFGLAWLATWAVLVSRGGDVLAARPRARRWLEGITGSVLVAFGVQLARAAR
jgi:threonine/homoserine/homoserine lactone efflux protein